MKLLFSDYSIFDAHCDTLSKLQGGDDLENTNLHFNLPVAQKYSRFIQMMAVWIDNESPEDSLSFALNGIERLYKHKGACPILKTAKDLKNHQCGVGFLLGIEGGDAIMGRLENLHLLFDKGVRLMTLTWNRGNAISDTAAEPQIPGGLTAFGRETVKEMERLGMAVDVSHISEKGFWDILEIAQKPIIASHSCAKALWPHVRNLTDAQFIALRKNSGIVGVNFYSDFLGGGSIEDILRHIIHFLELDGADFIGFGSDFDGIRILPAEICGTRDFYKIIERLLCENISEEIVRKIAYKNMENYFLRVLPA